MKRCLLLLVFGFLTAPVLAQNSPQEFVNAFYKDYTYAMRATPGWIETLLSRQSANMEPGLSDKLLRLAQGDPNQNEPYLEFDPFSNSQTGMETFTVGQPRAKQGLTYVPVSMRLLNEPGPSRVRLHFVLRGSSAEGWKIANVVYPAESGLPSWDLKGYLNDTFK